jgi:hypothetical protein
VRSARVSRAEGATLTARRVRGAFRRRRASRDRLHGRSARCCR